MFVVSMSVSIIKALFLHVLVYQVFLLNLAIDIRNAPGVSASAFALAIWPRMQADQAEKVPSNLNRIMPA